MRLCDCLRNIGEPLSLWVRGDGLERLGTVSGLDHLANWTSRRRN
jgi:hypothetical protein